MSVFLFYLLVGDLSCQSFLFYLLIKESSYWGSILIFWLRGYLVGILLGYFGWEVILSVFYLDILIKELSLLEFSLKSWVDCLLKKRYDFIMLEALTKFLLEFLYNYFSSARGAAQIFSEFLENCFDPIRGAGQIFV